MIACMCNNLKKKNMIFILSLR